MAHYVFICNNITKEDGVIIKGVNIVEKLLAYKAWFCTATAPNKTKLKAGDDILFYVCGRGYRYFIAQGRVASPVEEVISEDRNILQELGLTFMSYRIPIKDISIYDSFIDMRSLVPTLDFIKDKHNWGLHLRLPIISIGQEDFRKIISRRKTPSL